MQVYSEDHNDLRKRNAMPRVSTTATKGFAFFIYLFISFDFCFFPFPYSNGFFLFIRGLYNEGGGLLSPSMVFYLFIFILLLLGFSFRFEESIDLGRVFYCWAVVATFFRLVVTDLFGVQYQVQRMKELKKINVYRHSLFFFLHIFGGVYSLETISIENRILAIKTPPTNCKFVCESHAQLMTSWQKD